MVTAQASLRGSCRREHEPPDADQVRRSGVMGTVPSDRVGPLYESNLTVTAIGRLGGDSPIR